MNTSRHLCLLVAIFLQPLLPVEAAPGDLDAGFGAGGKVTTAIGAENDYGRCVAVQSDGKILVAGPAEKNTGANADTTVVRYNADGSLDTTFNLTGKASANLGSYHDARGMVVQNDGKIVVVGFFAGTFVAVRFQVDGSLDAGFNAIGQFAFPGTGSARGVVVLGDGKILIAGATSNAGGTYFNFAMARLNADGSADLSFNGNGAVTTDFGADSSATSVAVQSDGKIVLTGNASDGTDNNFAVARYHADGTPDLSFNTTGRVLTPAGSYPGGDSANGGAVQSDGKIVVAGVAFTNSQAAFAVVRFNPNGSLDTTFNGTGKVLTAIGSINDQANGVVVQNDGKIVVVGSTDTGGILDYALVRYQPDGGLDPTFHGTGKVDYDFGGGSIANGVALQSDGKIVAAGSFFNGVSNNFDFAVARFEGSAAVGAALVGPVINPTNGHIYYLLSEDSWTGSEARAQALGGHLVTINDAAENQWVFDTFSLAALAAQAPAGAKSLWIGYSDGAMEGTFVWSSGETPGYEHWIPGQPQSLSPDEDYAGIVLLGLDAGGWQDILGAGAGGDVTYGVVEINPPVPVANSGGGVPGLPGTTFLDFGSPAIDGGQVGGAATIVEGRVKSQVIYGTAGGTVLARTGEPAPEGATFSALGDPVFGGEAIGFSGIVKLNPAMTPLDLRFGLADLARFTLPRPGSRLVGLFSRVSIVAGIKQVARQGGVEPVTGGQFTKFPSFGLPRNRAGLVFTGNLRRGGGVTKANDFGVWREKAAGGESDLLLRKGQTVGTHDVKKLELMIPVANASDQRRSFAPDGGVMAAATFADGSNGLVRVAANGSRDVPVDKDTPVPDDLTARFERLSAPATRSGGGYAALARVLAGLGSVTPRTNTGIYISSGGPLRAVVRRGDPVPGHSDQRFHQLGHPLLGQGGLVGFIAALTGHGVTPRNRTALVQHRAGKTAVVARLGDPAPECGDGVVYRRFQSVVVTDTAQGQVVFTGIVGGPGVNARSRQGLWSISASGAVKLLLRSDQLVKIGNTTPQLRLFESLQARPASKGQGRSTDADGFVAAKVKLSDGRTGVLRIPLP